MNLIFVDPKEFPKWDKEKYNKACMALAAAVPIYKCAAMPLPWVSYFVYSMSPKPTAFVPEGMDIRTYILADGSLNTGLIKRFEEFKDAIGTADIPYKELAYEASLNLYEGEVTSAIWVGFGSEDTIPDSSAGKEFDKYAKAGKAFYLNVDSGELVAAGPPWKEPAAPHLTEVEGDIFEGEWDYFVHCANSYHAMKSGIARSVVELFPEAVEADNATVKDESKLGTYSIGVSKYGKNIVNLYGQSGIGNDGHPLNRNARYDAIYNGLFLLFESIKNTADGAEVAIPHGMCCGLAGGDWNIVRTIIQSLQERFGARVTIYRKTS